MLFRFRGLAPGVCFLIAAALGTRVFGADAVFKAVRVDKGPRLDGLLDDEVWKKAVPFSAFEQAQPNPHGEPSERTEVRVLYDVRNLYVGVYCYDNEPSQITANSMAHDSDRGGRGDDDIKVLLDPFQDKRTAYVFFVNPRGARSEGLAFGERPRLDWDGIWDAKARIRKDGWSAELRIPFKTISFNPGLTAWGINIERYIARKQETIRASGADLDSHFFNPNEAVSLEGISDIRQGRGITIRPYGLGGASRDREAGTPTDWTADAGIDVYKNFTPNFIGAFSYNTDFAETEVDQRQVNLTRFPLFYPEKRTFFLEGSEYFNFGATGGYRSSFLPFFSRRIGLLEGGEQVPILFGAKLYGRLGQTNIAVLDVATRPFQDETEGIDLGGKNFVAARVYQNLWEEGRVGFIFTNGNQEAPKGAADPNSLAGVDFRYATSKLWGDKNLAVDAWAVYNWNTPPPDTAPWGKKYGFGLRLDYPNDLWDFNTSYNFYGDALNPGLGFISRNGVQAVNFGGAYQPRPAAGSWLGDGVRQFFFELRTSVYWDLSGRLQTLSVFTAPLNVRLESGDGFEFDVMPNRDVLPEDFEVSEGVVIPQGPYNFLSYRAEFRSASHRFYEIDLSHRFGQFYSGRLTETEAGLTLKYNGHATLGLRATLVRGRLPQGNFNENIYELKADVYFSPDIGLMNYVQYDDISDQLGVQSRFRCQISPGNEIFLVYSKNWERRWDPMSRFIPLGEHGVFKIQLSIRP
jgi:hypothetical protein